jgi:hypothetical protein
MSTTRIRKTAALFSTALALARPEPAPGAADPEPEPGQARPEASPAGSSAEKSEPPQPVMIPVESHPLIKPRGPRRGSFPIDRMVGPRLVFALAPDQPLGLTLNAQPNLYFYLEMNVSTVNDGPLRVDFTLIDEQAAKPLLEFTVPGPLLRGVHAVRLSDHGVSLEPGRRYEWSVAVLMGAKVASMDRISRGFITRTDVPEDLTRRLETRGPDEAVNVLAESGLWYDAIMALSVAIEADGGQTPLRRARAALLDQVGLAPVAQYDRAGIP